MRIIIIIITFFINLQSLTKADDISDFEIEGLSVSKNVRITIDLKTMPIGKLYTRSK